MFCPNGTDWTTVWKDNGISPCFFDSFSSSVMFFAILTLGFVQYKFVKCHGIPVSSRTNNHWPRVYKVQILLTSVMIAESLVQMVLHDLYLTSLLHGYTVLTTLMFISGYLVSLSLLLLEKKYIVFHPGTCYELALLLFWSLGLVRENLAFVSWWSPNWWWQLNKTSQWVMFGLWVLRYAAIFILLVLGFITKTNPAKHVYSLISNNSEEENEEQTHSKRDSESTWSNIRKKIKIMLPIVWPTGRRSLQMVVIFCIGLLVGGRVVNVYLPIYSKKIVNSLTGSGQLVFQWDLIMVYCTLLYLRGAGSSGGLISQIRTQLWLNVQQYTSKCMEIRVFTHLHCLSLRWHLQRKTGEVLRIVDRGTDSMNTLLDQAVFQILPTIIDVVIAIVYFIAAFNYLFGIIIFTCVVIYVVITIVMMEWRTKLRREMNRLDNEANAQAVDSLLNFETVKYYGATEYEISRYQEAITRYQKAEWKSQTFLSIWQATQNSITTVGYLAGLMLCAWAVVHGIGNDTKLTVGDYVLLGSYLTQLFGPLNSLGGYYRIMQKSFIDMENMFELLDKEPEIKDEPDAKDLVVTEGIIEFDNVCFSYEPSRPILKNISFTVLPGQTCALVGHTGSGKSTVIRLLFRFYDIASGAISIDGQNIAKVTQTSLRSSIGVVPQDTVLFNRDIKYNVGYGRVAATDQEIEGAASAADIHERILTFPNKYDTVVGERGLKLSGGEKQRVAIARTLLKAPAIVLLDEATSALDTKTERNIQASLARVCENRTTIIIAHRLSTIIHADQILVLQDGEIIERGKHEELLAKNNHYASMWQQQLSRAELDIADEKDKGLQPANHC